MKVWEKMSKDDLILKALNIDDLIIINNALNEVCNGFRVYDFDKKIGATISYTCQLLEKINRIYNGLCKQEDSEEYLELESITIKDLIVSKNALYQVFNEIDDWEFSTRMGVTREEAMQFIEKITKIIEKEA